MLEIYRAFEQLAPCDCGKSQRAVTVENDRIIISCKGCGRQVITDEVRAVEDWEEELRYNPYHDPGNGRFCSGGGGGGVLVVPKGQKGHGYYGAIDTQQGEDALANEFEEWVKSRNTVPDAIQAKVAKVKEMTKKSPYGELQGDIKVTKDENGNYNLSYKQVRNYDRLKSDTIGVDDIPARKETTYTTYVLDNKGRRISTNRKTDTEYFKPAKAASDDWSGANANMGTSRTATRRIRNATNWADMQVRRAEEDNDPDDPV